MIFDLFRTFFKIGLTNFGGGNVMTHTIKTILVDRRKWLTQEEFADLLVMAQTAPGVQAINLSVFVGYKLKKLSGAVCSTLGVVLPSLLIILLVTLLYNKLKDYAVVASVFNGIRPAIVAIVAIPVFRLADAARIGWTNFWIPIASALLIYIIGVNPIYVLVAAGMGGYLYGLLVKPTE
ncbi:chromate transporter [Prevotella sp.]|uniref:chromate transporter n=1 Tax=Prevotella sp. TaxID=59823 RepID=UPI004028A37E